MLVREVDSTGPALGEDGVFPVRSHRTEESEAGGDSHQQLPRRQQEYDVCYDHLPPGLHGDLRLSQGVQAQTG